MSRKSRARKAKKEYKKKVHHDKYSALGNKWEKDRSQSIDDSEAYEEYWLASGNQRTRVRRYKGGGRSITSYYDGWHETKPQEIPNIATKLFGTVVYETHKRVGM